MAVLRTGTPTGIDTQSSGGLQGIIDFINGLNQKGYEESYTIVSGAPANGYQLTGPIAPGSTVTLPTDSRGVLATPSYVVGSNLLVIYLNGMKLKKGEDYNEIGLTGASSTTFTLLYDLTVRDTLTITT